MKNKIFMRFVRMTAAFLAVLTLAFSFVGCASRALPTSKEDLRVVGTVGEFEVLYEELRFLTLLYKDQLEDEHGKGIWNNEKTREQYLPELKKLIYENIEANYAVLTLAAKEGITLDGYAKEVQNYMDSSIETDFGGSRTAYKEFLKMCGLTDHYLRFTAAVDFAYKDLYYAYLEGGKILDGETEVKQYILQNFVYVTSICIVNNSDDVVETNRKRAEKYRNEVAGGKDIEEYIRYTIDQDPHYCFGRGEMEESFEEHAFALENPGDVSEVFLSTANGKSAWYFLQRMELTTGYVDEHYQDLFDRHADVAMNNYLEDVKEDLVFVPNEYGKSIDLLSVEPIEKVKDNTWIFILLGVFGAAIVIGGVIVLFRVLNPRPQEVKDRYKSKPSRRK